MKTEIYYSESNKRETVMRSERRYIIPTSPLTMINWWRVVLDEAQMVETPKNSCSKMVRSLPGWLIEYYSRDTVYTNNNCYRHLSSRS